MDRVRDKQECVCISVSFRRHLCVNERVRAYVCVCALGKCYKPNTAGPPSTEIKASASIPLRLQPNGTTRLKLTHVVGERMGEWHYRNHGWMTWISSLAFALQEVGNGLSWYCSQRETDRNFLLFFQFILFFIHWNYLDLCICQLNFFIPSPHFWFCSMLYLLTAHWNVFFFVWGCIRDQRKMFSSAVVALPSFISYKWTQKH